MIKIYIQTGALIVMLWAVSCHKTAVHPSSTAAPALAGWWAPENYSVQAKLYFGADNFFYQDTLAKNAPVAGIWSLKGDIITCQAKVNGIVLSQFKITSLTSSELVLSIIGTGVSQPFVRKNFPAITTPPMQSIAGTGVAGYTGNGGPATEAEVTAGAGVVADKAGNVYFGDNGIIREISAAGTISRYAGTGILPYGEIVKNGTPALSANILPLNLAIDAAGDIYFSDLETVYKINAADNTVTQIAGNGFIGFSGDGGPAPYAMFHNISGIAIDAANDVFIADQQNFRIREVYAATGNINTVAGTGSRSYSGDDGPAIQAGIAPLGIALDSIGNIYFTNTNYVRRIDHQSNKITKIAGAQFNVNNPASFAAGDNGPAIDAMFKMAYGIAVSSRGEILVADLSDNTVRKINLATGIITKLAGTGYMGASTGGIHASGYSLYSPMAMATDATGNYLFITDLSRRVHEVGPLYTN